MRILFGTIIFITWSAMVYSDQGCLALANFVGTYKQVNATCSGPYIPFGDDLVVRPYANGSFSGYEMESRGIFIGPSAAANSTDKCTVSGAVLVVQTCANDNSCMPKNWEYNFSGSNVSFSANGCTAYFVKIN